MTELCARPQEDADDAATDVEDPTSFAAPVLHMHCSEGLMMCMTTPSSTKLCLAFSDWRSNSRASSMLRYEKSRPASAADNLVEAHREDFALFLYEAEAKLTVDVWHHEIQRATGMRNRAFRPCPKIS